MLTAGLLTAWLASPAYATSGLLWQWPEGTERRYQLHAAVSVPEALPMFAQFNADAFVDMIVVDMVIRCTPKATLGNAGWELGCEIDDAVLGARGVNQSVGRMDPIVQEWATVLRDQASLRIIQGPDGRLREVNLDGVDRRMERLRMISEYMRLIVTRALAPLEIGLPKKGDDKGSGTWVQTAWSAYNLPSLQGSFGSVRTVHQLQSAVDGVATWTFHGDGVVASGESSVLDQPTSTLTMVGDGGARFDLANGLLLEASYLIQGSVTSSTIQSAGMQRNGYSQQSYVRYLPPERPAPNLGTSGEVK